MQKALILLFAILTYTNILKAQQNSVHVRDQNGVYLGFYNTVAAAYAAIPTPLTGPYLIEMDTGYKATDEHYPIVFTHKAGVSSTNTITVTVTDRSANKVWNQPMIPDTSDVFILDNADWMIFDGKFGKVGFESGWWHYVDSASLYNTFSLVNGSCNITIRDLYALHSWGGSTGNFVYLGTSPANASGNSDILIDNCRLMGENRIVRSQGTPAHPNRNITIRNSDFSFCGGYVLQADSGTGKTMLFDNTYYYYAHGESLATFVNFKQLSDTLFIEKNMIAISTPYNRDTVDFKGIVVESAASGGYTRIANNVISANVNSPYLDPSNLMEGIEFAGVNPIVADVFFNTIKLEGALDDNKPTPFGFSSAALHRAENNSASVYNIKNNIFVNTRQGGIYNTHLPIALTTSGTVNVDYNIYNGSAYIGKIGNNFYTNTALTAYQSAFTGGNEVHSDTVKVQFINNDSYRLLGTMYVNPSMQGITIPVIGTDYQNEIRTVPHRGADELKVTCTADRDTAKLSAERDTVCSDKFVNITSSVGRSDVIYQWQRRNAGTNDPFTDIPGGNHPNLTTHRMNKNTEFRLRDSCLAGGASLYSDTIMLVSMPSPQSVDTFYHLYHGAWTYSFYVPDADPNMSYTWEFSDGTGPAYGDSVTHAYTKPGKFTAFLFIRNECGAISRYKTIEIKLGIAETFTDQPIIIYPNPATNMLFADVEDNTIYIITDLAGRQIQQGRTTGNSIGISTLASGYYFIGFFGKEGTTYNARFIKE